MAAGRQSTPAHRLLWGRALALFLVWIVLIGGGPRDLPVGLIAAVLGAWISGRLLPEALREPHFMKSLGFAASFLRQAVQAGVDVARRAFDPALPLKLGSVTYQPRLPAGLERSLFAAFASMAPGTLPAGERADGALIIHCLDTDIDVPAQMAVDEARLAAALGKEPGHG